MISRKVQMVVMSALLVPVLLYGQHGAQQHGMKPGAKSAAAKMTDAQKISSAMSAAPPGVAKNATIMDWPDTPDGQPRQLRAGSNNWVCYPTTPMEFQGAAGEDPMCLDKQWQSWAEAWGSKTTPNVSGVGVAYMLRGDKGVSNTDPFATGPTATNQWIVSPPHLMIVFEDPQMLENYPTDPANGGPWVMWKGTPYAHLMVPVMERKMPATSNLSSKVR